MAAVTDRLVSLYGGQVYLEVTYDDVTMKMSQATAFNAFDTPRGRITIFGPKGTIFDQAIPVGTTIIPISGNRLITDYNVYASA